MAIISTLWTKGIGAGNLRTWTRTGLCTNSRSTERTLEGTDSNRVKFTVVPNRARLLYIGLDGLTARTRTIRPDEYGTVTVVRAAPVDYQPAYPVQAYGTYSGSEILRYTVLYQEVG